MGELTSGDSERAVGGLPLSIATSLAIESACGIHPEIIVATAPILGYEELWINLRTLYRNYLGSLPATDIQGINPKRVVSVLLYEMEMITQVISEYSNFRAKTIFYISNYAGLEDKYPKATLRVDNTPKQMNYTKTLNEVIKLFIKDYGDYFVGFNLKLNTDFKDKENKHATKALILTHIPYDLFSKKIFKSLTLLESHTGKIKEESQWYTKYYNGKELPPGMPFREDLVQILGDNETFRPQDIQARKDIIEIAIKYKWTAVTTFDKISYGIKELKNPYLRELLLDIRV